ncbi:MAG: hypothetical protein MJE68_07760, partial [Proteobacteria bacterium]|nr:hypothetical protein [Pseudomonadota bacterium]
MAAERDIKTILFPHLWNSLPPIDLNLSFATVNQKATDRHFFGKLGEGACPRFETLRLGAFP